MAVNGHTLEADNILIATGASPYIPPVSGLAESGYLTSTTAFELQHLPESILVLGGRYIALEIAQMFSRLGSRVTILQRSSHILPTESSDITDALTGYLEAHRELERSIPTEDQTVGEPIAEPIKVTLKTA